MKLSDRCPTKGKPVVERTAVPSLDEMPSNRVGSDSGGGSGRRRGPPIAKEPSLFLCHEGGALFSERRRPRRR